MMSREFTDQYGGGYGDHPDAAGGFDPRAEAEAQAMAMAQAQADRIAFERVEPRPMVQLASDTYSLRGLVWSPPEGFETYGRVVVLHGIQSHSEWYLDLGRTLAALGVEAHFPDRRGSGNNTENRGDTPNAQRLVDDVAERLEALREQEPEAPVGLVGISWGGKLAAVVAGERPDLVDALALICPGLVPRVDPGPWSRLGIGLALAIRPRTTFRIPLSDPELFTANPPAIEYIANDHLALRRATARFMLASRTLDRRVRRLVNQIRTPTLLMLAGRDRIIDNPRTLNFLRALPSGDRMVIDYPDAHHTLEFEPDPYRYSTDLADWLLDRFARISGRRRRPPPPEVLGE